MAAAPRPSFREPPTSPAPCGTCSPGGVDAALGAALIGMPALEAVRGDGSFVNFAGPAPVGLRGIRVASVWVREDGNALRALSTLAGLGRLTLRVAETLPLADAVKAHQLLEGGGLPGRLVLGLEFSVSRRPGAMG